jgi:aminoglycoside/choline kinase family phosphotransferase
MNFPVHPDELTAQWLTDTLDNCGAIDRSSVTSIDTQLLGAEKGITGVMARIRPGYDQAEAGAPTTLVAKFSGANPEVRAMVHSMGFYEREVRFYQQFVATTPIRTPRCYFAAIDMEQGHSLILLEDLAFAQQGSWVAGCSIEQARVAVTGIAQVHAAWWGSPVLEENTWLRLKGLVSVPQFQTVVDQTWQSFLSKLSISVTSEIVETGELLRHQLHNVMTNMFEGRPRTLIHDDFHADNLFFINPDGLPSVAVVDWQLATVGRGAVDVAWLVGGHFDTQTRRANENGLLQLYHATLVENGVQAYAFEQCWDDYRLALLVPAARVASSVGSHPGLRTAQGGFWDVVFPRYCQAIHDLAVGDLLQMNMQD